MRYVQFKITDKNQAAFQLLDFLNNTPKKKAADLSKEDIHKFLYGNKKYNDSLIRQILHKLLNTIKDFLAYKEFRDNPGEVEHKLLIAYRKRNLDQFFEAQYKQSADSLVALKSPEAYFWKYKLEEEHFNFEAGLTREPGDALPKLIEALDKYWIVSKLEQGSAALNYMKLFNHAIEVQQLDTALELIEANGIEDEALVNLKALAYRSLKEPGNKAHYEGLKSCLQEFIEQIDPVETRTALFHCINYCIVKVNQQEKAFNDELFNLYEFGLKHELLLINGKLAPFTYKNIIRLAIRLNKNGWTKTFIETYASIIEGKHGNDYYAYGMSMLFFEQHNFEGVVELLGQQKYKDTFNELSAKVLLFKAYYELGEFQLLDTLIDNYRRQISRKSTQSYHREIYMKFVKYFRKLLGLNRYDKQAIEAFIQQILNEEALVERDWFLNKVRGK